MSHHGFDPERRAALSDAMKELMGEYCPIYGGECARRECAIECQGRGHTSGVKGAEQC